MGKSKFIRIFRTTLFIILLLIIVYKDLIAPYISEHNILNSFYGINANPLRTKLNIPIIEKNMISRFNYDKDYAENRWDAINAFPNNNEPLHIYKSVDADIKTQKLTEETDGFRQKVRDSIFQQFEITFKFRGDTIFKREGRLVYVHNTNYYGYDSKDTDLNDHGIDSVAKEWQLNHLGKK